MNEKKKPYKRKTATKAEVEILRERVDELESKNSEAALDPYIIGCKKSLDEARLVKEVFENNCYDHLKNIRAVERSILLAQQHDQKNNQEVLKELEMQNRLKERQNLFGACIAFAAIVGIVVLIAYSVSG